MPMPPIDMDAPAMIPHSSKLPYLGEMDLTNVTIAYRAGQMFLGMGIVQLNIAFSSGLPDLFFLQHPPRMPFFPDCQQWRTMCLNAESSWKDCDPF